MFNSDDKSDTCNTFNNTVLSMLKFETDELLLKKIALNALRVIPENEPIEIFN